MLKKIFQKAATVSEDVTKAHVGAYAAQSAYFFMLCMIPIILLLLTLVQYTPVTKADVMTAVMQVFPSSVDSLMISIVNQVYNQSMGIIPVTIIVALWSAGKGVLAMTSGLNCIYECPETRSYIFLRIRSTIYTVLFIIVILLLLVVSVFGNSLNIFISTHAEFLEPLADWMIDKRALITPVVLMGFSLLIYKFLPNRKDRFVKQLPGAVFAAIGWMVISWVFSVYVDIFQGFSSMYGSLTTIVLIMLWLYFCMYSILLGGEFNKLLGDKIFQKA
ncbi:MULTISPECIES: YihY/virulence factor BrkB family protein [Claveliimonas]|uniref:YihY/virulence factor BrkB family protein n=1 Tax=Clostridia TaxID=186801 RepID=UPI001C3A7179|nr:YihY/virulence factor BrkB family protein [Claveliimonas bilis]MCQ5201380.1 YihY/virulence factor BrkB family protein [Mordavella massiliensis]BDZ79285.1 putative ribonuclease-like protein YfkH [Claveliimonas bilis]BDZ84998.1 putative ribonuclease-like protein YfkH [Claveliimonas bilis]HIZ60549.1 YihY/virulence factor BrkB family protein [Candidatus Dorea faecipullorum]